MYTHTLILQHKIIYCPRVLHVLGLRPQFWHVFNGIVDSISHVLLGHLQSYHDLLGTTLALLADGSDISRILSH